MSEEIEMYIDDVVAYLPGSKAAVYFAPSKVKMQSNGFISSKGSFTQVQQIITALDVVPWGEDNRFPQNIEKLMLYCGMGKEALNWKVKALYGAGIVPGKITGYSEDGKSEIFKPLDIAQYPNVYKFLRSAKLPRFYLEFLVDWVWYANCFPEMILSNDCTLITGMVHQESNNCRYKQMNDKGVVDTMYLSHLWGYTNDELVKFDPQKRVMGAASTAQVVNYVDGVYIKQLDVIDMYDPVASLKAIADTQKNRPDGALRSAILPVHYPSPNKPYYQLATWDGARLSGWLEIAIKIPSLIKNLYNNSFNLKYHVELPEALLWEQAGGKDVWLGLKGAEGAAKKKQVKKKILEELDKFLRGDENAGKTFVSFFSIDQVKGEELGRVKITPLTATNTLDKELLASASANSEILFAMGINPDIIGASMPGGAYGGNKGGSNIREGKLVYDALLTLERQVILEPLYLVRDYNREIGGDIQWEEDIVFKIRDVELTTLDKNTGTEKKIS